MWPCGHAVTSECHVLPEDLPCRKSCEQKLECGHMCTGSCGECLGGRVHKPCIVPCKKVLEGCGHLCGKSGCGVACSPCQKKCISVCKHSKCSQTCGVPCPPCKEPCPWKCEHQQCDKKCSSPCDYCRFLCFKQLSCGHQCQGYCGEACVCYQCEKANFVPVAIQGVISELESEKVNADTTLVKLPNCQHVFRGDALDVYVNRSVPKLAPGESLRCPLQKCSKVVREWDCWRYHRQLRARHDAQQEAKKLLIDSMVVPNVKNRQYKIEKSMDMLTHSAEAENSFASRQSRALFAKEGLDVTLAFALTNQVKMTWLTEKCSELLNGFSVLG